MARAKLPRRLEYLRPVLDALARFTPEELNEETDTAALESALRQRISGMSKSVARKSLQADINALGRWLRATDDPESAAHFILAFMVGGAGELLGLGDMITSVVGLLGALGPAPPGRAFAPLPQFERVLPASPAATPNCFLYIAHRTPTPPAIDLRVAIDGQLVIHDTFAWEVPCLFVRFPLSLPAGEHTLEATSNCGQAELIESFTLQKELHVGLFYWYSEPSAFSPELPPQLTSHVQGEAWVPPHGWREPS
jgi:hypothetical protein